MLIWECLDLEDVYGTGFSEALCDKAADRPCKRKIKDVILGLDRKALIDEGMGRCDASVVAEIEREVGWCRLWDCSSDRGPKAVAGLRAFVRIVTYPAHARCCCPICDIDGLPEGMSLLSHVIEAHTSATFDAEELMSCLLDSSSDFTLFFARIHCLFLLFR